MNVSLWLSLRREHARSRHALQRLDDHLLRDIGIDRAMAAAEPAIPLWRSPSSR